MAKRKYIIVPTSNPITNQRVYRPVIVRPHTANLEDITEFARANGYVRGQDEELMGTFRGYLQAMVEMCHMGNNLSVDGYFGVRAYLKGKTDSKGRFTSSVRYSLAMTPYSNFRVDLDEFDWACEKQ